MSDTGHDPYSSPELYDFFTLDGVQHPGVSWVESGGERAEEFQDQQVPLTTGAMTVFRFEPNGEITYTIKLWKKEHFATWRTLVAVLQAGKNRRPQPRVYVLADARLEDVQMTTVSFQRLGPRQVRRGGETLVKLTLKEVRKQKPYGGVPVPKDPNDAVIADAFLERNEAKATLDAARKAARAKP